jgi:hypothetical protein
MPYLEALSIYRQTSQALMYIRFFRVSFQVVYKVSLSLQHGKEKFRVGAPIKAEISISSSFNWNLIGNPASTKIDCYYELLLDPDVWLVSGCKRAHFFVQVCRNITLSYLRMKMSKPLG